MTAPITRYEAARGHYNELLNEAYIALARSRRARRAGDHYHACMWINVARLIRQSAQRAGKHMKRIEREIASWERIIKAQEKRGNEDMVREAQTHLTYWK